MTATFLFCSLVAMNHQSKEIYTLWGNKDNYHKDLDLILYVGSRVSLELGRFIEPSLVDSIAGGKIKFPIAT